MVHRDRLSKALPEAEGASKGTFPRLAALQTVSRGVIQAKSWLGGGMAGPIHCGEAFYFKCAIKRKQYLAFQGFQWHQTGEGDSKLETETGMKKAPVCE